MRAREACQIRTLSRAKRRVREGAKSDEEKNDEKDEPEEVKFNAALPVGFQAHRLILGGRRV